MRKLLALSVVAFLLPATSTAQAHHLKGKWWVGLSMQERLAGQLHLRHEARQVIKILTRSDVARLEPDATNKSLRKAQSSLHVLRKEIPQTRKAIAVEEAAAAAAAETAATAATTGTSTYTGPTTYSGSHTSLWLCIHNHEGGWAQASYAVDANGVPLYYGGLQMGEWFLSTYMGITNPESSGPGGTWYGAPSQEAQMAAAESAWAGEGYSISWLYGQWPRSGPACI